MQEDIFRCEWVKYKQKFTNDIGVHAPIINKYKKRLKLISFITAGFEFISAFALLAVYIF